MNVPLFSFVDICWTLLLGLIASGVVAWVSTIVKNKKEKFHLCVKQNNSKLFWTKDTGDVRISVKYKSLDIKDSLAILDLVIENDGKKDIMFATHFVDRIRVKNDLLEFISVEAKEGPTNASCELEGKDSFLLKWDLLKANERIVLECVAELKRDSEKLVGENTLFTNFTFDYRSDCIDSIEFEKPQPRLYQKVVFTPFFYVLTIFELAFLLLVFSLTINVRFGDASLPNDNIEAVFYSSLFNKYIFIGENESATIISPQDIPSNYRLISPNRQSASVVMGIILEVLVIIMVVFVVFYIFLFSSLGRDRSRRLFTKMVLE